MGRIELYAELLTNIRTVSLVASLETDSNTETRVELAADEQTITVNHEGHSASLRLPTRMTGGGTAALTIPPTPAKDLTLRLKVEETAPGLLTFEHGEENLIPWPASAMEDASDVLCAQCEESVVNVRNANEWRDLPNENWAEMMDFWHCHKPHEHDHGKGHGHEDATTKKGYSASSKLKATHGVGFAGLSYFILSPEDCTNIKVNDDVLINKEAQSLQCASCDQILGSVDTSTEGWKLYKWSISVQNNDSEIKSFPVQKWISTQLLAAVENSGVRRFVVQSTAESTGKVKGMLLWLFTDSLSFSSSHNFQLRHDPTRAMKILWKPVDDAEDMMNTHHFSHEQLLFPPYVLQILQKTLEEGADLLPHSARKFQDWRVGLLERFAWDDVEGSDAKVLPKPKTEVKSGSHDASTKATNESDISKIEGGEALLN